VLENRTGSSLRLPQAEAPSMVAWGDPLRTRVPAMGLRPFCAPRWGWVTGMGNRIARCTYSPRKIRVRFQERKAADTRNPDLSPRLDLSRSGGLTRSKTRRFVDSVLTIGIARSGIVVSRHLSLLAFLFLDHGTSRTPTRSSEDTCDLRARL